MAPGVIQIGNMHNQWVKAGPILGGKDISDRLSPPRIRTQTINGFRRKRDQTPRFQKSRGMIQVLLTGAKNLRIAVFHRDVGLVTRRFGCMDPQGRIGMQETLLLAGVRAEGKPMLSAPRPIWSRGEVMPYRAPVSEFEFILQNVVGFEQVATLLEISVEILVPDCLDHLD